MHRVLKCPVSSALNGVLGGCVGDGLGQVEEMNILQAIVDEYSNYCELKGGDSLQ